MGPDTTSWLCLTFNLSACTKSLKNLKSAGEETDQRRRKRRHRWKWPTTHGCCSPQTLPSDPGGRHPGSWWPHRCRPPLGKKPEPQPSPNHHRGPLGKCLDPDNFGHWVSSLLNQVTCRKRWKKTVIIGGQRWICWFWAIWQQQDFSRSRDVLNKNSPLLLLSTKSGTFNRNSTG